MGILDSGTKDNRRNHSQKKKKKTLLLAQDLSYARNLAANDEKVRRKSLKYLKKYLEQRSQASPLTIESLEIIWKGLFYSMWMSDKPLIQEQCAEDISHLIHCLEFNQAMLFFKVGIVTLQNEWNGIDYLRLDKFLMFVRRFLRQAFFVLKVNNFKKHQNQAFARVLEETILEPSNTPAIGLFMQFTEIYLEELAKVADGKMHRSRTIDFLVPYFYKFAFTQEYRVLNSINQNIFSHLMEQHKLGQEYREKYEIWKSRGFEGSINQIQKVIISDSESESTEQEEMETSVSTEKPLDPRAGRVDVEVPEILFNAKEISQTLIALKTDPRTYRPTRNYLSTWAEKFLKLYNGIYPIGPKKLIAQQDLLNSRLNVKKAAKQLNQFEEKLLARDKKTNKRKRETSEDQDIELKEISKKKKKKKTEHKNEGSSLTPPKREKKEKTQNRNSPEHQESKIKRSKLKKRKIHGEPAYEIPIKTLKKNALKIEKNEVLKKKLKKKKKPKLDEPVIDSADASIDEYNFCFERNSGLWRVSPKFNDTNDPLENTSTKKTKQSNTSEDKQIPSKLRGKSRIHRSSLKSSSLQATPTKQISSGSPKKVVINTKLNISQEIDDHILQVKASPRIPWDSSKKPGKPLLKTPIKASPINPFYKLRKF